MRKNKILGKKKLWQSELRKRQKNFVATGGKIYQGKFEDLFVMRKLIILGSSRKDGDTKKIVDELLSISGWDLIDLNDYNFSYYDYEHKNLDDDYLDLIRKIIANYDVLIFATPVYWYSMSGIMKVFFDRITDLLDEEKDLGRKLRGKSMAAISCSGGDNLGEYFWLPFSETARYLGMNYLGHTHTIADTDESENLKQFVEGLEKQLSSS